MMKKLLVFALIVISFGCESDYSQPPGNIGYHDHGFNQQDDMLSTDELRYIIEGSRQGYRE